MWTSFLAYMKSLESKRMNQTNIIEGDIKEQLISNTEFNEQSLKKTDKSTWSTVVR
jgi:hypothetical protein